jgi:hypothetical protein
MKFEHISSYGAARRGRLTFNFVTMKAVEKMNEK